MSSEELDLGSREKSPESVELTPALEIEGGRLSEDSEVGQEITVEETPSEVEMSEKDPERDNGQGSFDMQAMMKFMQQMAQELKEGQEKSEERLKKGQKEISLNCQRSQEQLNKQLSEKITTEVEKVTTRVERVAAEMDQVKQEVKKWQGKLEQEMDEEEPKVKVTEIIQGEVESNISNVSRRLRVQDEKTAQQENIQLEQSAIQKEIEVIQTNQQTQESQENEKHNKVEIMKEISQSRVAMEIIHETTELSRRVGEGDSSFLQQNNNKVPPYKCQLLKFQLNSSSQAKLKFYSKADNVVRGGRISKSRKAKIKRKLQIWLQVYRKLKDRAGRKVNKNRKAKFKRQLQTWLRISNSQKFRFEGSLEI
jgi:hypothetical protein